MDAILVRTCYRVAEGHLLIFPSAAYMLHWIGPALIQIMACRPFGVNPLTIPNDRPLAIEPLRKIFTRNFKQNTKLFINKNASENIVCEMVVILSRGDELTHWGRVTHICVSKLTIIGSDNGLSPGRRQAIIWTNAGILVIRTLGTNFSEILGEIRAFSFKKMHLKISSVKWRSFCPGEMS